MNIKNVKSYIFVLLTSLLILSGNVNDNPVVTTEDMLHWESDVVTFYVEKKLYNNDLIAASSSWKYGPTIIFKVVDGEIKAEMDGVNTISIGPVIAPEYQIANTLIRHEGSLIKEADIVLGEHVLFDNVISPRYSVLSVKYYDSSTAVNMRQFDSINILTHEFGHALGLPDNKDKNSTMYELTAPFEISKRQVDFKSLQLLKKKYSYKEKL